MTTSEFEQRLAEIERASPDDVSSGCDALAGDIFPGGAFDPFIRACIHRLISTFKQRADLRSTKLILILDGFVRLASEAEDVQALDVVRQQVRDALPLWLDRVLDGAADLASRSSALSVLSLYVPELPVLSTIAPRIVEETAPEDYSWYENFVSARRILGGLESWPRLILRLRGRIDLKSRLGRSGEAPPADVAVMVASLPYVSPPNRRATLVWLEDSYPGDIVEETKYLPNQARIELLTTVVRRKNRMAEWTALGGLIEIYDLLRAIFDYGPEKPHYTAMTDSIRYEMGELQNLPAKIDRPRREGLAEVGRCPLLWVLHTNLLQIFGLPPTKQAFAAWLVEQQETEGSSAEAEWDG